MSQKKTIERIEFQVGRDIRRGLVGLKFSQPKDFLCFPPENALELARQLIICAREIRDDRAMKNLVADIAKETKQ